MMIDLKMIMFNYGKYLINLNIIKYRFVINGKVMIK